MNKKLILVKIINLGFLTVISRGLGFFRQLLRANFLGTGAIADALLTASRLPNTLYKIFAEGPINAVLIPFAVKIESQRGLRASNKVIILSFFTLQFIFLLLCLLSYFFSSLFIKLIAPGWFLNCNNCMQQIDIAVHALPIFMISVFFFSANSFLSAALQIRHNFLLMGLQPILMNILFIIEFLIGLFWQASPLWFTWFYIINAIAVFIISIIFYCSYFSFFILPDQETWQDTKKMVVKLIPCFLNMGLLELNTLIDAWFISFLSVGSIALFSYSAAFMRVPLDLFSTLFSTVTLPMLSKITIARKSRLHFYLLETAKLFFWFCIPAMILLMFFASDIFSTLLKNVLMPGQEILAAHLLMAASVGLFFFALNRNILNIYYVLHETLAPTLISVCSIIINIGLNVILIHYLGAVGVVLSTSIASIIQTIMLLYLLHRMFHFKIYLRSFFSFALRYLMQLVIVLFAFYGLYIGIINLPLPAFFIEKWGLWLWVGPLSLLLMVCLFKTRRLFKINLYFLEF